MPCLCFVCRDGPIPRPLSPESMDTLEQAREYAATVTLNALRSRHQRGFDIIPASVNQGPINPPNYPPNYPPGLSQPLGYLTRYSLPLQDGGYPRRSSQGGGSSHERRRHSVDSLSNLANFASNPPTNSLSQVSQRLSNEFAMPQPTAVEAETVSPSSEEAQEIHIPSSNSDTPATQMERSGTSREEQVMVEVEGDQIQVAVVTDTRAAPPPQPRGESAYLGRIPSRRPRSCRQSNDSSSNLSHPHPQSLRGRSLARYQGKKQPIAYHLRDIAQLKLGNSILEILAIFTLFSIL